jgi:hypothetical protein
MPRKQPEPVAARRSKAPAAAKPRIGKADVAMPEATRPSPPPRTGSTPPPSAPRPLAAAAPSIADDDLAEITAVRAYAKWQARGCPIGDDKRDWFEAQEEVRRERLGEG